MPGSNCEYGALMGAESAVTFRTVRPDTCRASGTETVLGDVLTASPQILSRNPLGLRTSVDHYVPTPPSRLLVHKTPEIASNPCHRVARRTRRHQPGRFTRTSLFVISELVATAASMRCACLQQSASKEHRTIPSWSAVRCWCKRRKWRRLWVKRIRPSATAN